MYMNDEITRCYLVALFSHSLNIDCILSVSCNMHKENSDCITLLNVFGLIVGTKLKFSTNLSASRFFLNKC